MLDASSIGGGAVDIVNYLGEILQPEYRGFVCIGSSYLESSPGVSSREMRPRGRLILLKGYKQLIATRTRVADRLCRSACLGSSDPLL